MTGAENSDSGEKPFQFTDRRRFDPTTGARRDVAGQPAAGSTPSGTPANPADPAQAAQPLTLDTSGPELDAAKQEAAERTADLQRVTAEYANYRKRVDRDREQVAQGAKAAVLAELFGVLDDLDRAEAHGDLVGAFKAVSDKLLGVTGKLGLKRVGTPGDPFDPALHEAVQFTTSADVTETTVADVLRPGYSVSERLVRPAVVVVVGPEHGSETAAADEVAEQVVADNAENVNNADTAGDDDDPGEAGSLEPARQ